MWKVVLLSFLCVVLFGGIMIFQDVMNRFQREIAIKEGGDWFVASKEKSGLIREHAYFDREGSMAVGTSAYHFTGAGYTEAGKIGWADKVFFNQSNMELTEGRMPETAEEIAVTREGLSNMAAGFSAGQEITLHYARKIGPDGKPEIQSKQVKITGILPSYRDNWVDDIAFPDFFFTEEGVQSLDTEVREQAYYFYSLGEGHMDVDGTRLFKAVGDLLAGEGQHDALIYNRASYDVTMWGSQGMYDMAMVLCAILGSMSLIYLFSGYLHDRRSIYFRYLELGLTRGQLRGMVAMEWGVAFFPAACAALICSMIFMGICAEFLSGRYDISGIFYVSGRSMAMILIFTFGVFLLVLLWCCLGFRVKGLHEMTGQMPLKRLRHLWRKGDETCGGLALFQRRRGRMYPGRRAVRTFFTAVALSIVLYMSFLWEERYREDCVAGREADIVAGCEFDGGSSVSTGFMSDDEGRLDNKYAEKDPTLSQEEKEERRCEIPGRTFITVADGTLSSGMSWKQRETLKKIPGVQRVVGEAVAFDMKLTWDNALHSDFRNNLYIWEELAGFFTGENASGLAPGEYNKAYAMIPDDLSLYKYTVYGLEKSEEVDRELSAAGREYDSEAFWSGNQGILFALQAEPDFSGEEEGETWGEESSEERVPQGILFYDRKRKAYRFQGKEGEDYRYSFEENSIRSGEEIQILDSRKRELASAKVVVSSDRDCYRRILESVAQMYSEDGNENEFSSVGVTGGYRFIGSRNMMKRIQKEAGKPLTDHRINIWLEDGADRAAAEKKVTKILSQSNWEYRSNVETKDTARGAFKRQRMISIAVIVLVSCCYFFIMQTMERREMDQMRGRLQLLLQQGACRRDILRVRGISHVRGYLWGVLAIPLYCIWQGIGRWSSYLQSAYEEEGSLEGQGIGFAAFGRELLADWGDYLGNVWQWGIFILFILGAAAFTLLAEWRYLRKLKLYDN